jgi:hypothetical protein
MEVLREALSGDNRFALQLAIIAALGGFLFGALISGFSADALSRRRTKIIAGSVYLVAAVGSATAQDPSQGCARAAKSGLNVRSGIYCVGPESESRAPSVLNAYDEALRSAGFDPITTEIEPAGPFLRLG